MKNDIRSTIQKVGIAVTAGLLLVTAVQQMRAGQQTRSAVHAPDWTDKVIEEKIYYPIYFPTRCSTSLLFSWQMYSISSPRSNDGRVVNVQGFENVFGSSMMCTISR